MTTLPPPVTTLPPPVTTVPPPVTTLPPPVTVPTGAEFFEDFSSPAGVDRFRLDVHFRDAAGVANGPNTVWSGDHNMACEGPDTQRDVHAHASHEFFWHCAPKGSESGHLMTSMADIDGYTILSFSPNRVFSNFSQVCWDVNLTDLGGRKWTQVLVVPEAAFQANGARLDYISPVTQDVDQTAVRLPGGAVMFQNWDFAFRMYYGQRETLDDGSRFFVADKAKRYHHCLTDNGDGTVTMVQERANGQTYSQTVLGRFPTTGRVIFQDDNYTPLKDGPIAGFTWHWDNISVS